MEENRIAAKATCDEKGELGLSFGELLFSFRRADRVIWYFARETKEKGKEGFLVVLGVGDEIMIWDPKKFEERSKELEAIEALFLLRRDLGKWDE